MQHFLPDMKRVLNIEDLILYLLSEDAIIGVDDDPPKLTVSAHLSRTQALVNLQQIIATRGTIEQFMRALKRSSELHAGPTKNYMIKWWGRDSDECPHQPDDLQHQDKQEVASLARHS